MQDQGWPVTDAAGFLAAWQDAVAGDALLRRRARYASVRFAFESGGTTAGFALNAPPGAAAFTVAAPAEAWAKALQPVPPRHHHSLFAMRMRVPGFALRGEELAFVQHCHLARRVLEIGRWLAAGHAAPVPETLARCWRNRNRPQSPAATCGSRPTAPPGASMRSRRAMASTCSASTPRAPTGGNSTG
ncbi:hypothetical protein [Dankookia rubra]|uniref:hypothetical protein n=1 Tax=Dankookia rubra TaxID=1442381 RepID=UPI001F4FB92B|nr:hypothetical protein [Dankookia rubra]